MQRMGYYGPGGGLFAAAGLGQQTAPTATVPATTNSTALAVSQPVRAVMYVAGTASVAALAYHGYKRNSSIGWALVWGIFGGALWPLALPIAFAQGYGKPARAARNGRRRKRSK